MGLRRLEDRRCYIVRKEGVNQVGQGVAKDGTPIYLSAATNITHQGKSTVSSNPVASGNDRADHVTVHNDVITIKGVIDDTPSILGLLSGGETTMKSFVAALEEIRRTKELVDVHFFELGNPMIDCIITGMTYTKSNTNGDGLAVTLSIKKILLAPTNIVVAEALRSDKLAEKTEGGNKPAKETPAVPDSINNRVLDR